MDAKLKVSSIIFTELQAKYGTNLSITLAPLELSILAETSINGQNTDCTNILKVGTHDYKAFIMNIIFFIFPHAFPVLLNSHFKMPR